MTIYTATFSAVAVTAAQDVFEITAPTTSRVRIREIRLGQYSDAGDAQAELLSVLIISGYTVSGSGGSTVTPANVEQHSGAPTASSVVEANNTTVANTGTAVTHLADVWNTSAGWLYIPALPDLRAGQRGEGIWLPPSRRLVVRITAPADSLTMNGTMVFEETGFGGAG
jgi:hypothetical protein